eukprot:1185036-Prorocentrum_minimum.AAC.2
MQEEPLMNPALQYHYVGDNCPVEWLGNLPALQYHYVGDNCAPWSGWVTSTRCSTSTWATTPGCAGDSLLIATPPSSPPASLPPPPPSQVNCTPLLTPPSHTPIDAPLSTGLLTASATFSGQLHPLRPPHTPLLTPPSPPASLPPPPTSQGGEDHAPLSLLNALNGDLGTLGPPRPCADPTDDDVPHVPTLKLAEQRLVEGGLLQEQTADGAGEVGGGDGAAQPSDGRADEVGAAQPPDGQTDEAGGDGDGAAQPLDGRTDGAVGDDGAAQPLDGRTDGAVGDDGAAQPLDGRTDGAVGGDGAAQPLDRQMDEAMIRWMSAQWEEAVGDSAATNSAVGSDGDP